METIAIETEPFGEYANKFRLKVEGTHEPGEMYYRAYKNVPFMYLDEPFYGPSSFVSYNSKEDLLQDQESFLDWSRFNTINVLENKSYAATCKKTNNKNLLESLVKIRIT